MLLIASQVSELRDNALAKATLELAAANDRCHDAAANLEHMM
jgi:hypothetical protein